MKYILTILIFCSLNAAGQSYISDKWDVDSAYIIDKNNCAVKVRIKPITCNHIYVAVLPDTIVWDKAIKTIDEYSGVYGVDPYYIDPKPIQEKIVCILCHKVTEQQIKIINDKP